MIINKYNLSLDEIDNEWLSMIFQIAYSFTIINNLNILHNDAKPKNILYNIIKNNTHNYKLEKEEYTIKNKKYIVPINFLFKLTDFGNVQIKNCRNEYSNEELLDKIHKRVDLYELSRIIYRTIVTYIKNELTTIEELENVINSIDDKYKEYSINEKNRIDKEMKNFSENVKNNHLLRSLLYYSIENNLINVDEYIKKYNMILPSEKVINILNNLLNMNIDIFSLFDKYFLVQ